MRHQIHDDILTQACTGVFIRTCFFASCLFILQIIRRLARTERPGQAKFDCAASLEYVPPSSQPTRVSLSALYTGAQHHAFFGHFASTASFAFIVLHDIYMSIYMPHAIMWR